MKEILVFVLLAYGVISAAALPVNKWDSNEIFLLDRISDLIIEDINEDGINDLLVLAGNFVNIYLNKLEGIGENPDYRFYYNRLGDYIDVGEVDSSAKGKELLGLSAGGIKCLRLSEILTNKQAEYLSTIKIDLAEARLDPIFADFCFDINNDERDEIILLREGKVRLIHQDGTRHWIEEDLQAPSQAIAFSMNKRISWGTGVLFRPELIQKESILIQDINGDMMMDVYSKTISQQGPGYRFNVLSDAVIEDDGEAGKAITFMDINGDSVLDKIVIAKVGPYADGVSPFPYVKAYVYLKQGGGFSAIPNFFFKTILAAGQSPFIDVDGDGDMDVVSVWSDLAPGSKEKVIQLLVENTVSYNVRLYLWDSVKGFNRSPSYSMNVKINGDYMSLINEPPVDVSDDLDGDGKKDLLIIRNRDSVWLYLMEYKSRPIIRSVELIKIRGGFRLVRPIDLGGNGKKALVFIKEQSIQIVSISAE